MSRSERHAARTSPPRKTSRRHEPRLECLEARQLMTTASIVRPYTGAPFGSLQVQGGPSADTISISIDPGDRRYLMVAASDNPTPLRFQRSSLDAVYLHGNGGDDRLTIDESTAPYADSLRIVIYGDAGNDVLVGSGGGDYLRGGPGDDVLIGNGGDDFLYGEAGEDKLYGVGGSDRLSGGEGWDRLDGGSGADWMDGGTGNDTATDGQPDDTLLSVEYRESDAFKKYLNGLAPLAVISGDTGLLPTDSSLVSFDAYADLIWPGSVVQTRNLMSGRLSGVGLGRSPGKITLHHAVVAGSTASRVVQNPGLGNVNDAIHDILSTAGGVTYQGSLKSLTVSGSSFEQAAKQFNLQNEGGFDLTQASVGDATKAALSKGWGQGRTSFLSVVYEKFYDVAFETPNLTDSVFAPGVSIDDAKRVMGDGNPPGYISNVAYGRMLFLRIDSSYSEAQVKRALSEAYNWRATYVAKGHGGFSFSQASQKVLSESTLIIVQRGYGTGTISNTISGQAAVDFLKSYATADARYSPTNAGVPIGYTVRYLSNDDPANVNVPLGGTAFDSGLKKANVYFTPIDAQSKVFRNGKKSGNTSMIWDVEISYIKNSKKLWTAYSYASNNGKAFSVSDDTKLGVAPKSFQIIAEPGLEIEVAFHLWADANQGEIRQAIRHRYDPATGSFTSSSGTLAGEGSGKNTWFSERLKAALEYTLEVRPA